MTEPAKSPYRTDSTVTTTTVRYLAKPFGKARSNPPSLGDFRAFVSACEGLPDDLTVRVENGSLDEGGRRTVTLEVVQRTPQNDHDRTILAAIVTEDGHQYVAPNDQ